MFTMFTDIVVKAGLAVDSVNVTFTVTDHCGLSGSHILTVTITSSVSSE